MNTITKVMCVLFLCASLMGCSMGKDKEEVKDSEEKVSDMDKKAMDKAEGTLDDVMNYFKSQGVVYDGEKPLDNMDFAAHEGRSFNVDKQNVYMYRIDNSDANMKDLINQASSHNMITANRDGVESQYGASVNGTYLMVYDKGASLDELVKQFQGYKYKDSSDAKNATSAP